MTASNLIDDRKSSSPHQMIDIFMTPTQSDDDDFSEENDVSSPEESKLESAVTDFTLQKDGSEDDSKCDEKPEQEDEV